MINVVIITKENDLMKELTARLAPSGLSCLAAIDIEQALEQLKERSADLIVVDVYRDFDIRQVLEEFLGVGMKKNPLLMVIIPANMIGNIANESGVADFVIKPCDINELYIRVQRLVKRIRSKDSKKIITSGDLVIDMVSCEVRIGGRLIELTFKEYELLRFLAASKGRVFTREILLNKVWKYDYLGGERTVDVHIRRLRSKIEDADHTFIETVRNIGYRFHRDA